MPRKIGTILAILILFSGCSQTESDKTVLQFWQFWTDPQVKPTVIKLIQKFEQENPGIKVTATDLTWSNGHEKIVVAFASNSAPDVLELGSDWVPEFSSQNVLLNLSPAVDSIKNRFRMWEPGIFDGKIFAFPWMLDTRVLFYNKDLMSQAGLDPKHPPQIWNELLSYAKKINQPQKQIYGFGANAAERHRLYKKFLPFLWGNGGKILSEDNTTCLINSKEAVDALNFYIELTKFGLLDTQRRLDEVFMQGKIGFVISGGWLLKEIQKNNLPLNFGVVLMPKPDKNRGAPASFAG
ncbi:MAG TPA: extracellular solute-binding protein, partial [candidate division Zixibacteria bacterium]|nr:extracellular solute-binding protein [candidate division Zixibacteria bacterium]